MTAMSILEWCKWLQDSGPIVQIRESDYGFQVLVGAHLFGIILSVGALLWLDLRLMGLTLRRARISQVTRSLAPWFLAGFAVMFLSGLLLFASFATQAYGNLSFRIKMAVIVLAGLNALYFHFTTGRTQSQWDALERPPPAVRFAGAASLAMWSIVIVAGRSMSYTMF